MRSLHRVGATFAYGDLTPREWDALMTAEEEINKAESARLKKLKEKN